MVTQYLKEKNFSGDDDPALVRDVINAFMRGYACYTREDICETVEVNVLVKSDDDLFVIMKKGD